MNYKFCTKKLRMRMRMKMRMKMKMTMKVNKIRNKIIFLIINKNELLSI